MLPFGICKIIVKPLILLRLSLILGYDNKMAERSREQTMDDGDSNAEKPPEQNKMWQSRRSLYRRE